jgi:hypothetical protein
VRLVVELTAIAGAGGGLGGGRLDGGGGALQRRSDLIGHGQVRNSRQPAGFFCSADGLVSRPAAAGRCITDPGVAVRVELRQPTGAGRWIGQTTRSERWLGRPNLSINIPRGAFGAPIPVSRCRVISQWPSLLSISADNCSSGQDRRCGTLALHRPRRRRGGRGMLEAERITNWFRTREGAWSLWPSQTGIHEARLAK